MWAQILLIGLLLFVFVYLVRSKKPTARRLALFRIGLVLAVAVGVAVILVPQWLTAVANWLGIGRGTDLLLYALIIVFLLNVVTGYKRFLELGRQNTKLARELTLSEARLEDLIRRESPRDL
jgi:hypothetical protein